MRREKEWLVWEKTKSSISRNWGEENPVGQLWDSIFNFIFFSWAVFFFHGHLLFSLLLLFDDHRSRSFSLPFLADFLSSLSISLASLLSGSFVRTVRTVHQVAQAARVDTSAAFFSSSLSFSSWGEWQCKLNWSLIDLLGLSSDDDHWLAMVS